MARTFPYPLTVGEHPETGDPVIGFVHEDMFIFDAFSSDCGRFPAPPQEYGLTREEANTLVGINESLKDKGEEIRYQAHIQLWNLAEEAVKEFNKEQP